MNQLILHLALLAALLHLPACAGAPEPNRQHAVDSIVVAFSPSGTLDAADARTLEITDAETIDRWVAALEAVPKLPARGVRLVKFAPPISEHRVELRAGGEVLRVARLRGGLLDVDAHDGWAFYSGEDEAFTALVLAAIPGT
jgi:hypothetical protein